jgi:hypothetical protein
VSTRLTPSPATWHQRFAFHETARILALAAVAAWLLHPFATSRQVGAGDALWYANMLADFCLQLRAGIFPVFVGQTEFAFNGAVYPLRVAPLYQHLGGLLDLLTGHHLGWFTLQHLTVIVCGVAGIFSCYFSLCAVARNHRWQAAAFATLYLSCPGLLGTIYTQDLYMTWMTVPFAPLAVYGIVRTFERDDLVAQLWLAAPLAALWLAHSPIALWFTLIAFGTQCVRLLTMHRTVAAWKRAALGAVLFAALGSYPFVSVASLQIPGTASAVTAGLAQQERITNVIREVFPAVLFPLSEHARALSDLQLGYALWLVLVGSLTAATFGTMRRDVKLLLAASGLLLALVLPVPLLTDWLWAHLPEQIKRVTFYWPMHRFYLVLAAVLALIGQLASSPWIPRSRHVRFALNIGLSIACGWSLFESRQFIRAASDRTSSAVDSVRRQRPENLLLMNHAYGLFAALPPRFSNGVIDPRAEVRLTDRDTLAPLPSWSSHPVQTGRFVGTPDANPGILNLQPLLRLAPGRRYQLEFTWSDHEYRGVLQLVGRELFREYALPASGQPLAFGAGEPRSNAITLWSTQPDGDEILVRFIPTAPGAKAADFASFASFSLNEIEPVVSTVEIQSFLPLRIVAKPTSPVWLETPRMAVPGYRAVVDGREGEIAPSAEGLVQVSLPPGTHTVTLSFVGPWGLRFAYWVMLVTWTALGCAVAIFAVRRFKNLSAPAQPPAAAS